MTTTDGIAGSSGTEKLGPFRLGPVFSERIWGRADLSPWYRSTGTDQLVGEAWLTGPACVVETGPLAGRTLAAVAAEFAGQVLAESSAGASQSSVAAEFPLLVKMLFPNDKLSVQVHPDDSEAQAMGMARGKTECWYVLEAAPGATVALGLKPGVTREMLAASAADSTMEALIEQVPVAVGDMVFVDAGTVHAIGPGVVLLETQQTSDVTYRLYDYGRPRELHLEAGLRVVKPVTAAGKVSADVRPGFTRLIEQRYFVVDRFEVAAGETISLEDVRGASMCLVTLAGSGTVVTAGGAVELELAKAVVVPAAATGVTVQAATKLSFVRCFAPLHRAE